MVSTVDKAELSIQNGEIISVLPIPEGTRIMSAQSAVYWDDTFLHVWHASQSESDNSYTDDIYYTKTADFVTWTEPIKVIDREDGIRDPTIFVEGDYLYLFCQCFDGVDYRPIRLYKLLKTANFTDPDDYLYVGAPIDAGSPGEFDDSWAASACVVKIDSTYWMVYEAKDSNDIFSVGRAYASNIEGPWTKDGQLRDTEGSIIYAPSGSTNDIVPDTFIDGDTLVFHYIHHGVGWRIRYVNGDFPNNLVSVGDSDLIPFGEDNHYIGYAHIDFFDNYYYFLLQTGVGEDAHGLSLIKSPVGPTYQGDYSCELSELDQADDYGILRKNISATTAPNVSVNVMFSQHLNLNTIVSNLVSVTDQTDIFGIGLGLQRQLDGTYRWLINNNLTENYYSESFDLDLDEWYAIEFEVRLDSSNGQSIVIINGKEEITQTNINTGSIHSDQIQIGAIQKSSISDNPNAGTIYFDHVELIYGALS